MNSSTASQEQKESQTPAATASNGLRALALGALGVTLLMTALLWNRFDAPLIRDEGEYAYAAQLLTHGRLPYEDSFLQKPPMCVYYYGLAHALAPDLFWFPRVLAYLCVGAGVLLLGEIARREFGAIARWPVLCLATPMVFLPAVPLYTAATELFMLAPLLGMVFLYARSRGQSGTNLAWFSAGALCALTLCHKYTPVPILALVFAAWAWDEWRARRDPRLLAQHVLAAAVAFLAASAATLGLFLVHDSGRHLWECTVQFNRAYVASSNFGWERLLSKLGDFWGYWRILFLLPLALLVRPGRRALFWFALFLAAWLSTGGSAYPQYYAVLMPFWALLAAAGLVRLAQWSSAKWKWSVPRLTALFTVVTLVLLCLADRSAILGGASEKAWKTFNAISPFPESAFVAQRLAQITAPGDPVYVAGSEPQILCYAQRFSPTRFVIAYPLMMPTPLAARFQQQALSELERRPPAAIVLARSNASWLQQTNTPPEFRLRLDAMLARDYERVGAYVLAPDRGHWQEPVSDKDFFNASLVLYRRK